MNLVIDFDLSTALLAIVIYLPILFYFYSRKNQTRIRLLIITAGYFYFIAVIAKTLFPIYLVDDMKGLYGQNVWSNMNLVPFLKLNTRDIKTSFYNVLLFIPFGLLVPLIKKCSFKQVVWGGFLSSLAIECLQVLIALVVGFGFRHFDVNDLIFNTLGTVVGYGLYRMISTDREGAK